VRSSNVYSISFYEIQEEKSIDGSHSGNLRILSLPSTKTISKENADPKKTEHQEPDQTYLYLMDLVCKREEIVRNGKVLSHLPAEGVWYGWVRANRVCPRRTPVIILTLIIIVVFPFPFLFVFLFYLDEWHVRNEGRQHIHQSTEDA